MSSIFFLIILNASRERKHSQWLLGVIQSVISASMCLVTFSSGWLLSSKVAYVAVALRSDWL